MRNVPKVEDRQTPAEKPAPVQANTEAERQLVRQAQAGDSSAYEELVRIHHHRILAVVGGILRGGEDVEDIAQQALVKAYLSLKRFDQRSGFGTCCTRLRSTSAGIIFARRRCADWCTNRI
jgi:RNA polymerase sigma-70 factor (ECF subfamily)